MVSISMYSSIDNAQVEFRAIGEILHDVSGELVDLWGSCMCSNCQDMIEMSYSEFAQSLQDNGIVVCADCLCVVFDFTCVVL